MDNDEFMDEELANDPVNSLFFLKSGGNRRKPLPFSDKLAPSCQSLGLLPLTLLGLVSTGVAFDTYLSPTGLYDLFIPVHKTLLHFLIREKGYVTFLNRSIVFEKRLRCCAIRGHSERKQTIVFAACGTDIYGLYYKLHKRHCIFQGHKAKVDFLLVFGTFLVSIARDRTLMLWLIPPLEDEGLDNAKVTVSGPHVTLQLPAHCTPTVLMHPVTYVNKVLIATQEGQLYLWNLKTRTLLHTFQGWSSPVLCVVQSPVMDVVGIGLESGLIVVHNLKYDVTLFKFQQNEPVTCLSFQTGNHPILVSGDSGGNVCVWNLETKIMLHAKTIHEGAIVALQFFLNEACFITCSADNSIKVHVFDDQFTAPRLTYEKFGNATVPSLVRWYARDHIIASLTGSAQINSIHVPANKVKRFATSKLSMNATVRDEVKAMKKKGEEALVALALKTLTADVPMATTLYMNQVITDANVPDITTCHKNCEVFALWNHQGNLLRAIEYKKQIFVTSTLSVCGNFVFTATANGVILVFNAFSGILQNKSEESRVHEQCRYLFVDAFNSRLTSVSEDGLVKIWSVSKSMVLEPVHDMKHKRRITCAVFQRDSNFLVLALEEGSIAVVDVSTQRTVRLFQGHECEITNLALSNNTRWLVSVSLDSHVRMYDVATGRCVDWFRMFAPVTSCEFAPDDRKFVTTHIGQKGIFLWINKFYYNQQYPTLPQSPPLVKFHASYQEREEVVEIEVEEFKEDMWVDYPSPAQIAASTITFSPSPLSKWAVLANLDLIRQRNKIKTENEPIRIPFILSNTVSRPDAPIAFVPAELPGTQSKITDMPKDFSITTKFIKLLQRCRSAHDYSPAIKYLMDTSPSVVDFEIQSVNPSNFDLILAFVRSELEKRTNYEIVQTFLSVFLKAHTNELCESPEALKAVKSLTALHNQSWRQLESLMHANMCLIDFFLTES